MTDRGPLRLVSVGILAWQSSGLFRHLKANNIASYYGDCNTHYRLGLATYRDVGGQVGPVLTAAVYVRTPAACRLPLL